MTLGSGDRPREDGCHGGGVYALSQETASALDVSNRRSRFAAIRVAIGSQRFQIARIAVKASLFFTLSDRFQIARFNPLAIRIASGS